MGLFSSSPKIPQPPLPNLAIHLYTPLEKVFKPDELVTGHIALTPVVPITPSAIEVALFGHSLVWHRTSRKNSNDSTEYLHWRDNAPLFEVAENVLSNGVVGKDGNLEPGQTYTFPFGFRFPLGTGNTRFGQYKEDVDERWVVTPHNLPPTFLHTSKYGDETEPDYAKIEYGMRVRLVCPGVFVVQGKKTMVDMSATAPVLFQPPNPHLEQMAGPGPMKLLRHSKPFCLQSSILTGQAPSEIGFRQSMRDRFSSSTPRLDFAAAIELPDLLASGSEFRFRATFSVTAKTGGVTQIPPVQFSVLKLDLLDFTFVRACRDEDASTGRGGWHRSNKYENMTPPDQPFVGGHQHEAFDERKTHLNSIPNTATVELDPLPPSYKEKDGGEEKGDSGEASEPEQSRSCEVWFTARVPGFTAPSFKSFAIARVYRVKAKLGVEIGGKQFALEAESHVSYLGGAPV